MPRVPKLKQGQRLRAGSPTRFRSTESARVPGESLTAFGEGVSKVGAAWQDYMDRTDAAKKKIKQDQFTNELDIELKKLRDEISRNGSDGEKDVELFEKRSAEIKKNLSKKYGGLTPAMQSIATGVKNSRISGTIENAVSKRKTALKNSIEERRSMYTSLAAQSPEELSLLMSKLEQSEVGIYKEVGATDKQINNDMRQTKAMMTTAAVQKLVDDAEYDTAEDVINTQSIHLDGEKQAELRKYIRNQKWKQDTRNYTRWQRKEALKEHKLKEKQAQNFQTLLNGIVKAETPDEREYAREKLSEYSVNNMISRPQTETLKEEFSDSAYVELNRRLIEDGEDPDALIAKTAQLVQKRELTPEAGSKMFRYLRTARKQQETSPEARRNRKNAYEFLSSRIAPGSIFTKFEKPERQKALADAQIELERLMQEKGVPPMVAARKLAKIHSDIDPDMNQTTTTVVPMFGSMEGAGPKDIQDARKQSLRLNLMGQLDDEQFNIIMDNLERKEQEIDDQEVYNRMKIDEILPGVINFGDNDLSDISEPSETKIPLRR